MNHAQDIFNFIFPWTRNYDVKLLRLGIQVTDISFTNEAMSAGQRGFPNGDHGRFSSDGAAVLSTVGQ